jgi:hypothetical protein
MESLNGKFSTAYCSSGGGWWSDCDNRRYRYQRDGVSLCDNYLLGSQLAIMHGDLEFRMVLYRSGRSDEH